MPLSTDSGRQICIIALASNGLAITKEKRRATSAED
jgi:hypothetical protein